MEVFRERSLLFVPHGIQGGTMHSADSLTFVGFISSFLLLLTLIPLGYTMRPMKLFYACMAGFVGLENVGLIILLRNSQNLAEEDRMLILVCFITLASSISLSLWLIVSFQRHTFVMWRKIWHDRDIWLLAGQVCLEKLCDALWHACCKTVAFIWGLMLATWIFARLIILVTWMLTKLLRHITMLGWIFFCYVGDKDWREQVKSPKRAIVEPAEDEHTPATIRGQATHLSVVQPTSWGEATRDRVDRSFRRRPASNI